MSGKGIQESLLEGDNGDEEAGRSLGNGAHSAGHKAAGAGEEEDAGAPGRPNLPEVSMADPDSGLSDAEVEERLRTFGYNELVEKKENIILVFLSYFTGPMAIMIWIAIIVELINAEWPDFAVLLVLQILNGTIGFVEENSAGDAIAALKDKLAPECTVRRNGAFERVHSRLLVPGDVVSLKLGDIVPADLVMLEGQPMEVDQAALTGESLPVTAFPGDSLKMGATIKRGDNLCHVVATGSNTFFGNAAQMVASVENVGRFQIVLFKVSMTLLALSLFIVSIILATLLTRHVDVLRAIGICVVLLVAAIPIAMQVVSTSTMAVGARRLAEKHVIVAKLSAIEEMAGMRILCSDKTGTLTQNKLQLFDPILIADITASELNFYSALAAKRMDDNMDAIDTCIVDAVRGTSDWEVMQQYEELEFLPFDPVSKRTEATVRGSDGKVFKAMKGAPQVVLRMCNPSQEVEMQVSGAIQELADRGFRSLGVARTDEDNNWVFLGVLSLFDPPREDTKETIEMAQGMGIEVKMVTGDQTAIAKETCRALGMGTNILGTEVLDAAQHGSSSLNEIVRKAHGFAEVYPEHKFQIVQILMEQGFTCGMTGDGVNDAPALKKAHIGIAVDDATDAARAAADIVLTKPGLKEIIDALLRARKIFARVRHYCIYRISATISLIFFFFVAVLSFRMSDYFPSSMRDVDQDKNLFGDSGSDQPETVFTLPVIALVLITILNDGTIITICRDKVIPSERPQSWNLPEIFAVSSALGAVLVIENIILLVMGLAAGPGGHLNGSCGQIPSDYNDDDDMNHRNQCAEKCDGALGSIFGDSDCGTMSYKELKTLMYLSLSLSAFFTVYAARTREGFYTRRPGWALLSASVFSWILTTLFSKFAKDFGSDLYMGNLRWKTIGFVWAYCIAWFLLQDLTVKRAIYYVYDRLSKDESDEYEETLGQAIASNKLEEEHRHVRATIGGGALSGSRQNSSILQGSMTLNARAAQALRGSAAHVGSDRIHVLESRVDTLERQVIELRVKVNSLETKED